MHGNNPVCALHIYFHQVGTTSTLGDFPHTGVVFTTGDFSSIIPLSEEGLSCRSATLVS